MKQMRPERRLATSLLLLLALPLSMFATDIVVADQNGNQLTYSFDSEDGPATFKGIKSYAEDADKAGHIVIADAVTDGDGHSHEVLYIGSSINNRQDIVSIVFGQNVVSTGSDAFYDCQKLTGVTLNAKLETMGNYTFQRCRALVDINLEDAVSLTTINRQSFQSTALVSVTLPASLTTMGWGVFSYMETLKSVTILGSLESSDNAFAYTVSIESFDYRGENVPAEFYRGGTGLTSVSFGPGVRTIGDYAFQNNNQLGSITFDAGITDLSIGRYAFNNADKVRSISFPAGLRSIGDDAFYNLDSLRTVTFADGCMLESLGNYAFEDNYKLQSINLEACTQLTEIKNNVFEYCYDLKAITIPASVTTFGSNIFYGTDKIETFTVLSPEVPADLYRDRAMLGTVNIGPGVKKLGSACFYNNNRLKQVNIDPEVSGLVIDQYVFSECDSLLAINLPVGVVSLGYRAFRLCRQMAQVTFAESSPISEIPAECFAHCNALETITLPDAVQVMGNDNFYECTNLREVNFGTGLTTLPNNWYFFAYCNKLAKVVLPGVNYPFTGGIEMPAEVVLYVHPDLVEEYRVSSSTKNYHIMAIGSVTDYDVTTTAGGQLQGKVPDDVAQFTLSLSVSGPLNGTDINYLHSAFPNLQVLNLRNARIVAGGDKYNQWSVSQNGNATVNTWYGPWETEDDVVGNNMFYNMPSLQSLSLPEGTTRIGEYAMAQNERTNLRLTDIYIPASVTQIGRYAFYYTGIGEVTVPAGVTRLEEYTFHHCERLQRASLPDGITYIGYACFANDYELQDVNIPANVETIETYAFNENHKRNTPVVIPNTCKTIGNYAFHNNYMVPSVTVSSSVESIGSYAFNNCDSLRTFVFPQNITQVADHVLWECNSLESVTLSDGTTHIYEAAFADCPRLSSINITPDMPLVYIGNYGFDDTAFTSMTLPNSITDMGYSVFQNCHQLESVNVPTGMNYVPASYCYNCENLTDIQMHDGIRTVQYEALYGCTSLESIDLNDQITVIRYRAFQDCHKLNLAKLPDALTELGSGAFCRTTSFDAVLTVPANVNHISDDCFNGSAIKGVVLHDGMTLGSGVFCNNDSLRSVRLPQDLKILPRYTFYHCDSLQYISLPEGLEEINDNCFDLSGLKSIDLPESLQYLGNYALASCQLREFRMPDGYASDRIGSYVVAYNRKLEKAYMGRNLDYTTFSDMSTFSGCDSLKVLRLYAATPPAAYNHMQFRARCVLEVPEGSEEAYRTSQYCWKEFKEIRGFFTGDELDGADFAVLKDLYEQLDGANWTTQWNLENNHNPNGKWPGVTTAKRGAATSVVYGITDIDLTAMGLTGELPASVFGLKDLQTLNLSRNSIGGDLGTLVAGIDADKRSALTTVNLRANRFTGDLYAFASALPTLTNLNVSYNRFTDVSQVIDNTVLKDLNLEMQFVDFNTKQVISDLPDDIPVVDITVGVPAEIEFPSTYKYRHSNQDFGRNPSNLLRPYCYNVNYDWWSESWELGRDGDGMWDIDTYDTRTLNAPKNQVVAYEYNWQTVLLRFDWEDGDVNADRTVDVTDLMSVVNYAFNERKYNGERFNYGDADVNGDSKINVIDIVGNVERILAYTPADEPAPARYIYKEEDAANVIETTGTAVALHSAGDVAAMQLTVAGATQADVDVADELKSRFTVAMQQADDGLRIVIYSTDGRTLGAGSHTVLSQLPEGAAVVAACLSDAAAKRMDVSIKGNDATGIQSVEGKPWLTGDAEVYDISGRRMDTDWQSLPSGVYVIRANGKQYKVKK